VATIVAPSGSSPMRQAEVLGAVNDAAGETGVVVNAAGSMPGDLHKLWRARDPEGKGYHVEYGYSCMGYEIPGSIGIKLAAPGRRVITLIGDGSWLMLSSELATAVAEGIPLTVVLVDNQGYASIGALSRSLGAAGFGTHYRRQPNGMPAIDNAEGSGLEAPAERLPVDFAKLAEGLGARAVVAATVDELRAALAETADAQVPVVICVETDRYAGVPNYEGWWDVPVAETSERAEVDAALEAYLGGRGAQRIYLGGGS
jgi:3D-(3,5/4)-trihydroxycyclohexane-1,2-dione acylhydrolase (decyclizing)